MASLQSTSQGFRGFRGASYRLGQGGEVVPAQPDPIPIAVHDDDDDDDWDRLHDGDDAADPLGPARSYVVTNTRASHCRDVAAVWLQHMPENRYAVQLRDDISEFILHVTMFMSMVEGRLVHGEDMTREMQKFEQQWADLKVHVTPLLSRNDEDVEDDDSNDDGDDDGPPRGLPKRRKRL